MDPCWQLLPSDLVGRILLHLDAGTRRDLNMRPRRLLTLPQLELHRDKIVNTDYSIWLTLPREGGTRIYQLMWALGAMPMFFYQRTERIKFMTVQGIDIWRDTKVHQDMFTGVREELE